MTEFLNNIWVALSTPNEGLIKALSFPLQFIEAPLTLYLIIAVFNLQNSKKQNITYIGLTIILSTLGLYTFPSPYNIIINYITSFIVISIVLKTKTITTIIASILPSFLFTIIQSLLLNPYITILNITYEQLLSIAIYRIPLIFLIYTIVFLFAFIIKHKKIHLDLLENFDKKSKYLISLNLLFGLAYIIIEIIITMKFIDILPISYTFANFVMLFLYFSISLYSISKVTKLTIKTKQLESAEAYNETLRILHDSVRGFKHDFDNIVTTIGGFINTDDIDGLKKYYKELQKDCEKVNNLYILNPESINNPGIYSLLTTKYSEATEKGIDVNLYFFLDLNELNMDIYKFTRILGILLDNAIEASKDSNEKKLNISFRKEEKNNRNVITIENSYSNKDVDTEAIYNKGYSEKENHSGIGLWEVRKIINKLKNVNLFTTKNNNMFKQELEIYFK